MALRGNGANNVGRKKCAPRKTPTETKMIHERANSHIDEKKIFKPLLCSFEGVCTSLTSPTQHEQESGHQESAFTKHQQASRNWQQAQRRRNPQKNSRQNGAYLGEDHGREGGVALYPRQGHPRAVWTSPRPRASQQLTLRVCYTQLFSFALSDWTQTFLDLTNEKVLIDNILT